MVVVKRATVSEIAQNVRTGYRETSPGGWTSKRSSCLEEKFQGRGIVVKKDALYVTGKVGEVEVELLLDSRCTLSLISTEVCKIGGLHWKRMMSK